MRKALAFLLAFMMLMPLASSAFAADFGGVQVSENAAVVPMEEEENLEIFHGTAQRQESGRVQYPTVSLKDSSTIYGLFSLRVDNDTIGEHGIGQYDLGTDTFTMLQGRFSDSMYVSEYVDGVIYSVVRGAGSYEFVRFNSLEDFKDGMYTTLGPAPEQITGLCMDYSTNVMYAVGGNYWNLYMVDMQTYEFKVVTNLYEENAPGRPSIPATPWMMSMDADGNMYIIVYGGILYKINKYTGEAERIGDTGLKPNYAQSLVYNYDNNTMYWCFYNSADSAIVTVDLKDASVKLVTKSVDCEVTGAFFVPQNEIKTPTPVEPTSLTLNKTELTLIGGESETLKTELLPYDKYIADRNITWTTSDEKVATVENGYVYAWGEGTATITASNGSLKATCTVNVENPEKYYRELSDAVNAAAYGDDDYVLFKTVHTSETDKFVVYQDKDRGAVARSASMGRNNAIAYFENVYPLHLIGGTTVTFDYKVSSETSDYFEFFVDDSMVMYDSGEVDWTTYTWTAPKTGDYLLTWAYMKNAAGNGGEDMAMVDNIVFDMKDTEELQAISVSPEEMTLITRVKRQLTIGYTPVNVENADVTYESSDPAVARVSETGVVTARSEGTTTITVTSKANPAIKATATVHVVEPRTIETLDYSRVAEMDNIYSFTLGGNESQFLEINSVIKHAMAYTINMEEGQGVELRTRPGTNPAADTVLYVFDEDFNQVAFNNDDIGTYYSYVKFVPEHAGKYYIVVTTSANYNADSGDVSLVVRKYDPIHTTGITITPTELEMSLGGYAQVQYELTPANTDYTGVTFKSSDESIVQVLYDKAYDQYSFYGAKLGSATVTVTTVDGNFTATVKVDVVEKAKNPEYDGMVYAYNYASSDIPAGFVKYDPTAPIDTSLELVAPHIAAYYAGAYYDGNIYAYRYLNLLNSDLLYFNIVDGNTFTRQFQNMMNVALTPADMTFDYTTGTMFAIAMNNVTGASSLATVDIVSGEITVIKNFRTTIMNLEATTDGTLYAMGNDGMLYEVNKETAELTEVVNMGIACNYIGTMTYDHYADLMYWFPYSTAATRAVAFDPATTDIEYIENVGKTPIELTCGVTWADPDTFPVDDSIPVEGVELNLNFATVTLDGTTKVKAVFTPANASDKRVKWTSENEGVATVDRYGNVTGVNEGSTYIAVTTEDGGFTARIPVTVEASGSDIPAGMAKVTLSVPQRIWSSGDGYQLLLDKTATTFDRAIIPMYLTRIAYSDAPEVYREFAYTIPENLDGTIDSKDIIVEGSMSIFVEPGIYDWVIVTPSTSDRCIYIANNGRSDNFNIRAGYEYTFTVSRLISGNNVIDGASFSKKFLGYADTDTRAKYTVTFMGVGEEVLGTYVVREGEDAVAPVVGTNSEGIPFVEWKGDFTNVKEDTVVKAIFLGDVNKDTAITAGDATMVLRDVVSLVPLNAEQKKLGDANQNGDTDGGDATIILRYVVGLGWGVKE